jgi:alpha-glucosidase
VRGVPVIYYGEEIGMVDGGFPTSASLDPVGQRYSWAPQFLLDFLGLYVNRDTCRTPMQWSTEVHAGFSDGFEASPWLPVNPDYERVNVALQESESTSLLNTYKRLLSLRRDMPALHAGSLELLENDEIDDDLLVYQRKSADQEALVVINFASQPKVFKNTTTCDRCQYAVGTEEPEGLSEIIIPPFSGLLLSM